MNITQSPGSDPSRASRVDHGLLLESVIKITEQRDRKALSQALGECLSEIIEFTGIILLRLPQDQCRDYLEVQASLPAAVSHQLLEPMPLKDGRHCVKRDPLTALCLRTGEIVSINRPDQRRLLLPILVDDEAQGVLDIHGCDQIPETLQAILTLVTVYSNYLALIDANEYDTLTGLLNRKTFDAHLNELIANVDEEIDAQQIIEHDRRAKKQEHYHWVGILDIDNFKKINDGYGHIIGDEVLLLFSNLLKRSFRNNDLLFRYGGEEFVVVLSPQHEEEAIAVFERFCKELLDQPFPQVGRVTVSIGMVSVSKQEHHTHILEKADRALYYAKSNGRNRVCNYHDLVNRGELKVQSVEDDIELF